MSDTSTTQSRTRIEYRCPLCGGADIQDLCTIWVDANTSVIDLGELHRAELYTETRWCNDCEEHPTYFNKVEVPCE